MGDFTDRPPDLEGFATRFPPPGVPRSLRRRVPATTVPVELDDRTWRMIETAVRAYPVIVLVGPPGTGKGTILHQLVERVSASPEAFGFEAREDPAWPDPLKRTPDESMVLDHVIGGLMPTGGSGEFRWGSGFLLDAIRDDRWLILDEINRADLDRILGPLLTWLAGEEVELGTLTPNPGAPRLMLGWSDDAKSGCEPPTGLDTDPSSGDEIWFRAGRDFRVLGTFNAQDAHRVFSMGQALSRRMRQIPVAPPTKEGEYALSLRIHPELADRGLEDTVAWPVSELYGAHLGDPRTVLGPALFLEIPRYVLAGIDGIERDGGEATEDDVRQLLAEAYVVTVGRALSSYSEDALSRLEKAEGFIDALTEEGWTWVQTAIVHLS